MVVRGNTNMVAKRPSNFPKLSSPPRGGDPPLVSERSRFRVWGVAGESLRPLKYRRSHPWGWDVIVADIGEPDVQGPRSPLCQRWYEDLVEWKDLVGCCLGMMLRGSGRQWLKLGAALPEQRDWRSVDR